MAMTIRNAGRTKQDKAPFILMYGPDGIGKTSLACEAPDVFYLRTPGETPPKGVEVDTTLDDRGDPMAIETFNDLYHVFKELREERHPYKWLVFDSADGLEPIIWRETCERKGWPDIETPGFGKGYLAADDEWNEVIGWIEDLKRDGMGVIMLAHPKIIRFDSPITDPYNRYTIKIQDRANALLREKADIVAFLNYRVSIREKEVARQKTVSHAEGGKVREIGFTAMASYDAKNRYDMPDTITYKKGQGFTDMAKHFPEARGVA